MTNLFRVLLFFSVINLIVIVVTDSSSGMMPVWTMIISCCFLLSIHKICIFLFSKTWFKGLFILCLTIFLVVEILIIFNGYKTSMDAESDFIIVLGARVRGSTPSLTLQKRLDKAYDYLTKHQETLAVLSGGQGSDEDISEAEAMKRYLVEKGIEKERLFLESKSTSTNENLLYSYKIIDEINKDADVIVITSRFHILRSKIIAKSMGKKIEGIGVNTLPYLVPNYYLREFLALIKSLFVPVS